MFTIRRIRSLRLMRLATAALLTIGLLGAGTVVAQGSAPDPAPHQHPAAAKDGDKALADQIRDLQAKVSNLEAARPQRRWRRTPMAIGASRWNFLLAVTNTVTHPEGTDWQGHKGRISKELITQSVPDVVSRYVHICGPVPMTEAVKTMLGELGVPPQRIKTEAFGPALGKPEPTIEAAAPPTGAAATDKAATVTLPAVTFASSDKSASLSPDKTILDVADEIGVEIDNSCRVGTCGTCRVKLLSGQVTMAVEDGLERATRRRTSSSPARPRRRKT